MSALRLLILAALAAGAIIFAIFLVSGGPTKAAPKPFQSTVKVLAGNGHGSGFYIGSQLVVTAAHVVDDKKTVDLKLVDGEIIEAEVLWANERRDIAMLKIDPTTALVPAVVSCHEPLIGDPFYAEGNPANMDFVTVWGNVGGLVQEVDPWLRAFITNNAVVPGQSGGPVFNAQGEVIGITVGVMVLPMGFSASLVGIGYAVPTSELCMMMGW
ncbi:S1C family serine protease [Pseudohoeflea coraliihabitans]|uniref:Serine protease n=1 Tax=Pseudohoeflea coraliihabitans TaxID=2860393 RepID=A0ABS6WTJ1_9HYPH|nr:serine protease [Pseudohoeflea sp. DP4N28-3]MBW3099277.1 serine protease [Pseudohoeflea sp. DP4N28-3]